MGDARLRYNGGGVDGVEGERGGGWEKGRKGEDKATVGCSQLFTRS